MRSRLLMWQWNCPIKGTVNGVDAPIVIVAPRGARRSAGVHVPGRSRAERFPERRFHRASCVFSSLTPSPSTERASPPCSDRFIERPPASPPTGGRLDSEAPSSILRPSGFPYLRWSPARRSALSLRRRGWGTGRLRPTASRGIAKKPPASVLGGFFYSPSFRTALSRQDRRRRARTTRRGS